MRTGLLAALITLGIAGVGVAQDLPRLWIMGSEVSFGSPVTLTLRSDEVGQAGLLLVGMQPLPFDAPLFTGKGPLYIGQLSLLIGCGPVSATGRIDLPITLPGYSAMLNNIHIAVQGYVAGRFTNPATIALVQSYFEPQDALVVLPPVPQKGAMFGDRVAVGDFNGDGQDDLAVGAWFETVGGQVAAGRAYIMWGPDYATFVQLTPPNPGFAKVYGGAVLAGDLDLDGIDDLVIGEGPGEPATTAAGHFYFFRGGDPFLASPVQTLSSAGVGVEYSSFGRRAALGDLTGDGFPDLAVGVDLATVNGVALAGRVDVYFGPDFLQRQELANPQASPSDYFGSSLAIADANGDGVNDLIEGSGRADVSGVVNVGRCHIYDGPSLTSPATIECPLPDGFNTRFGETVAGFDANADGRSDLVTRDDRDRVYVFWAPDFTAYEVIRRPTSSNESSNPSLSLGYAFATGDINLDGIADLIIPDAFAGPATGCGAKSKGGYVYVAFGPYFSTFERMQDLVQCAAEFGWSLEFVGPRPTSPRALVVGSPGAASIGLANSGQVIVLR